MTQPQESRLEAARRRARTAQTAIAATAVALFGVVAVAAKASHPASSGTQSQSSSVTELENESSDDGFDFGNGFVGPAQSGAAPSFQSHSS
jgi:hypothetical protein